MSNLIEAKILKGFRDFKPENEIPRKNIIRKLESIFESFGFLPIDTPVLEYTDVLLGKGSGETDKQLYRFKDNGKRDVAMRFDLTVPFARFMAMYNHELPLPFKRYHISKVWRGENTQKGRYREFMQCDFDIVGCDTPESDFEILSMMDGSFKALNIDNVTFCISHRALFNDFLTEQKITTDPVNILRTVDKLAKIGEEKVKEELSQWCSSSQVDALLSFISIKGLLDEKISEVQKLTSPNNEAIVRLSEIAKIAKGVGIIDKFILDMSITRGLDYYTGIVYETFINELPAIGSVCSGGRYNNLASLYTKEELPGVGSSIGLDRLLAALTELEKINSPKGLTNVIIFNMGSQYNAHYFKLASELRQKGIVCEVYLQNKKMNIQFKYAEKKAIPFAILLGEDEITSQSYTLKNLETRENYNQLSFNELIAKL